MVTSCPLAGPIAGNCRAAAIRPEPRRGGYASHGGDLERWDRLAKLLILRRLGQAPARDLELAPPVVALGPQDRDGVPHDP